MSRKSVPFTVPAGAAQGAGGARRRPETIDARSDEWVSDRNTGAWDSGSKDRAGDAPRDAILDLAAERSLIEIMALSLLTPIALYWFWLAHAMSGRARFY